MRERECAIMLKIRSCAGVLSNPSSLVAMCGLALAHTLAPSAHAASPISFQTFLVNGGDAPGQPAGTVFAPVSQPVIDNLGNISVGALFNSPELTLPGQITGLYYGKPGAVELLPGGSPAPGTDFNFILGNRPNVANGRVGFNASITDGVDDFSNSSVLYAGTLKNLSLIGVRGMPIPGTGGALEYSVFFDSPRLNDAGYLAFNAGVQGADVTFENNQGVFAGSSPQTIQFVARQGDPAPGIPNTTYFSIENLRLRPDNSIVYSANTRSEDPGTGQVGFGSGIWTRADGQAPQLLAASGQQAPGYAPGVVFDGVIGPQTSSVGSVLFQGFVSGPGVDFTNFFGLYINEGPGHTTRLVARQGDPAAGLSAGTELDGIDSPRINRSGQIAFTTELRGPDVTITNNTAIYVIDTDQTTRLIAVEGSRAPGDREQYFDNLTFGRVGFNALGQVAIYTGLRNPGDDFVTDAGLFISDPLLGLISLVRTGDFFEVAPGDIRQIADISLDNLYLFSGGEDGQPSSFNDLGQFTFGLTFVDGTSGIFVSSAIPAPGASALLLAGAGLAARRRRR